MSRTERVVEESGKKSATKRPAAARAKPKTKAKGKDKPSASSSAAGGAKAKAKAKPKKTACPDLPLSSPPPFGSKCPLKFNGCRVYHVEATKKWRVYPKAGSKYDKSFGYTSSPKKKVWADLIAFCQSPSIPRVSVNFA
jgi:hypothetical protein